jgi:hypothetical protein
MLIIMLVPAAMLFSTIIRISANSRDRVEAANLAAQQIDVGRATCWPSPMCGLGQSPFGTLAAQATGGTVQTGTAKEGGITFTIAQSASWVNESTNACGGTGDGAPGTQPILAMTEKVTWPDMGSSLPIVAQTDVAPPAGYYSSALGNLAVDVVDSNNAPVVGASVTITGPTDAGPLPTGPTGCAFAAFLAAGAYNFTATLAGYVDMDENSTATKSNLAIGAGSTVPWTLNYAPAAVVPISLTATAAVVPGTVTYPTNGYPVTVSDTAYLPAPVTYSAPLAGALDLWPYSNGYDIYPGGCADSDPAVYPSYTPFTVSQGVTSPDTLHVYGVSITGKDGVFAVTNLQVTVTDTSSGCNAPNNSFSFSAVAGNSTVIGLPLGTFEIAVTGKANGGAVSGTIPSVSENGTTPVAAQTVTLS